MFQNTKIITLPEKLRHSRRIFWRLYLGTLVGIPLLTGLICFSIMGWEGMVRDMGKPRPQDIYMIFLILFCYSIPFLCFYIGMRSSHKECLEKYDSMLSEERKQLDRQFQNPIQMGEVLYTQRYFLHRDKYRLFFYYIHSYEEIIWAYQAQSLYQMNQMDFLPGAFASPSDLRFHTIVLVTRDGKKYAVFMGNWSQLVSHLSRNTILGYGKEQKQQAKERL